MKTNWFKHIHSTKHLTSDQYLQSTFWDWAESFKAHECPPESEMEFADILNITITVLVFNDNETSDLI
jgi:hypothetical protein